MYTLISRHNIKAIKSIHMLFSFFQMPRRFHSNDFGDGGYTWSKSTKYDYTDDNAASGNASRSDSLASGNNKHLVKGAGAGWCGRNCCLITLLILGALLLAIGIGLLVYYLLLNCKSKR